MADHYHHDQYGNDQNQVELQEASPRLGRVMGVGQEPEEEVVIFTNIFTIIIYHQHLHQDHGGSIHLNLQFW